MGSGFKGSGIQRVGVIDFGIQRVGVIDFKPATQADQDLLESYLPDVITSVDDLPDSLPAGDVQMVGEITLDGNVIATTPAQPLGTILMTRLGFIGPSANSITGETWRYTENNLVVGQYQAADIVYLRRPSYGTFSTHMNIAYLFGVPQTVQFAGLVMDVDRISHNAEHKENCYDDWIAFNRSSGMRGSALEHQIPEQLFSTEENPAEGISTAKAIAIATAEGQRIYTITQANADQLQNITIDDGARAQIQQALNAGLEVTVHESPISLNGWTGSGYTLLDPDYGVGGYLISGGESGGLLLTIVAAVLGALEGLIQVGDSGGPQTLGERLKNMARYARYAKVVGGLALLVEILNVSQDASLSWVLPRFHGRF